MTNQRWLSRLAAVVMLCGLSVLVWRPRAASADGCDIYCTFCKCNTATGVCECTDCKIVCRPE